MKTTEAEPSYFGSFDRSFREHAHQLVAWGYQDALPRIRSEDEEEPSISGFIANAIRVRLQSDGSPPWCDMFFVSEDRPEETAGRVGRSRLRPDIVIETNSPRQRPEYVFEAKRLHKGSHGVDKYVGQEGMRCFIDGAYGHRYDEAGMLGYVQSDSPIDWQISVKKAINNEKDRLGLFGNQRDITVIDAFPIEWITEHRRDGVGRPVAIYHILLDCCRD